jgi:holliday junction DNA helicase RuvA
MIAFLAGNVREVWHQELILDVGGVGYLINATSKVLSSARIGSPLNVVVYTDVKEEAINLFGFHDRFEREVFLLLKKVKGIGPKLAMNVVSGIGPENVLSAIGAGDIGRLNNIPGVGRKTAERILVELREHVGDLLDEKSGVQEGSNEGPVSDAVLALEKLGFPKDRARNAVEVAFKEVGAKADAGSLLRQSLSHLS